MPELSSAVSRGLSLRCQKSVKSGVVTHRLFTTLRHVCAPLIGARAVRESLLRSIHDARADRRARRETSASGTGGCTVFPTVRNGTVCPLSLGYV